MKIPLVDYVPENDIRWTMVAATELYFSKRYPQCTAVIEEICATLIANLGLTMPVGVGCVGLLKSWEDRLDTIIKNNL